MNRLSQVREGLAVADDALQPLREVLGQGHAPTLTEMEDCICGLKFAVALPGVALGILWMALAAGFAAGMKQVSDLATWLDDDE